MMKPFFRQMERMMQIDRQCAVRPKNVRQQRTLAHSFVIKPSTRIDPLLIFKSFKMFNSPKSDPPRHYPKNVRLEQNLPISKQASQRAYSLKQQISTKMHQKCAINPESLITQCRSVKNVNTAAVKIIKILKNSFQKQP